MKSLTEVINEGLFDRLKNKYKKPYVIIEWNSEGTDDLDGALKSIQVEIKDKCDVIVRNVLKRYGVSYTERKTYNSVSTMRQLQYLFSNNVDVAEYETMCAEMYDSISKMVNKQYRNDAHIEIETDFEEWTIWIPYTKNSTDGYCVNFYIGRD